MIKVFQNIEELFLNNTIRIQNKKLENLVKNYKFVYISKQKDIDTNQTIYSNIEKSNVIIINQCKNFDQSLDNLYFLIGFERTIILIKHSSISFLISLFSMCKEKSICYLQDTKKFFIQHNINFLNEINVDSTLNEEKTSFKYELSISSSKKMTTIFEIWEDIISCISCYLIKQSYSKLDKNRINSYLLNLSTNSPNENEIDENEYIELRRLGSGTSFMTDLVYYIEREELFAIKKPKNNYDYEIPKLGDRELNNYLQIKHPFLPKFIGKIKHTKYIMIEFINGQDLLQIKKMHLDENEKLTIIFELILIIQFLHSKHFIFRDLKPDNIMIDQDKKVVLIDFDRMINIDTFTNDQNHSNNFGSLYAAPEVNTNTFSYECDIYSIGKIIFYLMNEVKPTIKNYKNKFKQCPEIQQIYFKCTDENPSKRPTSSELLYDFFMTFYTKIKVNDLLQEYLNFFNTFNKQMILNKIDSNQDEIEKLKLIAFSFYKGEIVEHDINKAIYYYSLAADKNDPEAQYNLGQIYYDGQFISPDSNKAIHYFTLAANQYYANGYFGLGNFYFEGKFTHRDMNKAIYYFSIASSLNNPEAQYNLGTIYMNGHMVPQDINKAIYYYSLASDQNFSKAQYNLGCIYYENTLIERDIDKSIHYFTLAANQNDSDAQIMLGHIYYNGEYAKRDIEKAIHYYQLGADNSDPEGYFCLGLIYNDGIIQRDLNKSIYYYTLSANKGLVQAQYNLGLLYYNNSDIHKAIYYYTLASNQNFAPAQFKLGFLYSKDYFDIYDINKSIYYYTLAANQNHLLAQYNLAVTYSEDKSIVFDINKSIYYFTLAANQNNPQAQYNLGVLYSDGQYIKRDIEKAIHYYTLASNQKFPQALMNLAILYHEGRYVKQDINKAIHYYLIAAEQKCRVAIYNLGFIYYNGPYETQNIYKAIHFFSILAEQNDPECLFVLGLIYNKGIHIKKDIKKAIYYYSLASDQNHPVAQYNLAIIYENDDPIDIEKVIHYYSLSAENNYANAQFNLALIYIDGKYLKPDINKAIHYYTLASNQNHSAAQHNLGMIYCEGNYVPKDMNKGIYFINKSSANGSIKAHFVLGFLYHDGQYIQKDMDKAISLYKEASSFNNQYAKNNLGVIYKNGFFDKIKRNIELSIEYLKEAINKKDDMVAMYNLANIYLYKCNFKNNISNSIELLIRSSNKGFSPSLHLLSLALIKYFGFDILKINNKLKEMSPNLINEVNNMIQEKKLFFKVTSDAYYSYYKQINFLYNYSLDIIQSHEICDASRNQMNINISSEFYDGFYSNS